MKTLQLTLSMFLAGALAGCPQDSEPDPEPEEPTPYTPGQGALFISDPVITLDGYTIWNPQDKQNHPEGGLPEYVYLAIEAEGVALPGPTIALPGGGEEQALFVLDAPSMTWEIVDETTAGLTVVVNSQLSYRFDIDDFEEELSVARVDLTLTEAGLESRFILIADGCNGVAHQAAITATVDGVAAGEPTAPWTIETRGPQNGPGCSY